MNILEIIKWATGYKLIEMIINAIKGGGSNGGSSGSLWKCSMFFPYKSSPWPGNSGVDSPLSFASCHGNSWENAFRQNCYRQIQAMGGDTIIYIAERLYGHDVPHLELQMFLTNRAHPVDGHRMNDSENEVVKARAYGVNRWIVSLFNDDNTYFNGGNPKVFNATVFEDYIKQMCECYSWATVDEVAFMTCLESDERFNVNQWTQIIGWIRKYNNGKRIIVGSANAGFLKAVRAANKDVEMWAETSTEIGGDGHPFKLNMSNADAYVSKLKDLIKTGKTWAGEYGDGSNAAVAYVSQKAIDAGCAGIGCYKKG